MKFVKFGKNRINLEFVKSVYFQDAQGSTEVGEGFPDFEDEGTQALLRIDFQDGTSETFHGEKAMMASVILDAAMGVSD